MDGPYLDISNAKGRQQLGVGAEPITIGRNAGNALVLNDDLTSRFHCVIESNEQGFLQIRDLKSKNGTRVNGQIVSISPLANGDVITVGRSTLTLVDPNAPPATDNGDGVEELEEVTEADDEVVENLSDADVVELDALEAAAQAEAGAKVEDDRVVEVEGVDDVDQGPVADPEAALRRLADTLPDKAFGEGDIELYNSRGKIAHAAKKDEGKGRKKEESATEAVDLFRVLLLVCFRIRATDVHIEPKNEDASIRIRVDGNMVDVVRAEKEIGVKVASLVKILSDIDISQRNIVQEGHFSARVPGRRVDYRVSFAPAMFGQKLVIRVLDTANTPLHIKDLDLPKWMFTDISKAIEQEAGMVLVCGPTGSGKTTTLYAVLRDIDVDQRNVVTIEDPVEIQLEGVTQIPVNEEQGNSFSALLKSVLRQDPDVILVGEVRDAETARIAMQAAMTGHLVFSTVHSRDTVGTVFRLLDLGVEPYLVASGLHLVVAQRLVRQLCPYCKMPTKPTAEQLERMGKAGEGVTQIFNPRGCARCLKTGFAGRRAIFELLTSNEQLRDTILRNPTINDIYKTLSTSKFERLVNTGFRLVAEGVSTFDEVERTVS